ncbi:MAG: hypothetical protein HPY83_12340 [Anaerolineae bacterium]|nr:hypothetical protein [Anaerolineae bacterium]
MEDSLGKVNAWASRGTLEQFRTEARARLDAQRFDIELVGDSLMFYQKRKEGGILGLGAKWVRKPVLRISTTENGLQVQPQPLDPEFLDYLAARLSVH